MHTCWQGLLFPSHACLPLWHTNSSQQRWFAWPNTSRTSESGTVRVAINVMHFNSNNQIHVNLQVYKVKCSNQQYIQYKPTKGIRQSQSLYCY